MARHQPSDLRRHQLFSAALQVCAEKGYEGATVSEIVSRAGLSKGGLYHHFGSKRELFLALLDSMMQAFKGLMLEELSRCSSVEQAMLRIMDEFFAHLQQGPTLMRGLFNFFNMAMRDEEIRRTFLGHYEQLVRVAARMIKKGQQQGELAPSLDPEQAAWMLLTAGDAVLLLHAGLHLDQRGVQTAQALVKALVRSFAVGAPAAPGPAGKGRGAKKRRQER